MEQAMGWEFDYVLTLAQWETLRVLRRPAQHPSRVSQIAIDDLIALELAVIRDQQAVMTPRGRQVLLRGSPLLWDVAA